MAIGGGRGFLRMIGKIVKISIPRKILKFSEEYDDFTVPANVTQGPLLFTEEYDDFTVPANVTQGPLVFAEDYDDFT